MAVTVALALVFHKHSLFLQYFPKNLFLKVVESRVIDALWETWNVFIYERHIIALLTC